MVLVVRQNLKMGSGKIASQCAHAATCVYAELKQSHGYLLRQWEQCGQPKIVVLQESTRNLREAAESIGLPTYVVADAGRTQVSAGLKTVLAMGTGSTASVHLVTGKQRAVTVSMKQFTSLIDPPDDWKFIITPLFMGLFIGRDI